ncbi:MAG: ABC transporter permease [Bacilli bacterium]|jgi:spermidine/putrescine transport system permease protein|nr:ABC transporter permease [Bacilli bacterium]
MNQSFKKLATPYRIWLYILALFPIAVMFLLIFINSEGISLDEAYLTLDTFSTLKEPSTLEGFKNSFLFASIATIVCLLLGYILAYSVFRSKFSNKFLVLTIFILPMWSNLILRIEALGNVMEQHNIIQDILADVGITYQLAIRGTSLAVLIGLIFTYLPFMILPIYTALEKIDYSLEEAALDLGATSTQKFWKVIFPLSLKGVVTGSIMVFLPCMSGFAIPKILGDGNILLIGNIIDQQFKTMMYNQGSLLAVIIIVAILGSLFLINKVDKEGETLL